jgi:hypothetical protein
MFQLEFHKIPVWVSLIGFYIMTDFWCVFLLIFSCYSDLNRHYSLEWVKVLISYNFSAGVRVWVHFYITGSISTNCWFTSTYGDLDIVPDRRKLKLRNSKAWNNCFLWFIFPPFMKIKELVLFLGQIKKHPCFTHFFWPHLIIFY